MEGKLVLIDGHSILNRAFYGMPALTNSQGRPTGAVYGFLNILFKILEEEKPQYLAVAFDLHAPTFRHKMYEAYKGTRKPMPEELREQVPVMKEVLKAMDVCILEKEGYEADDILGTWARKGEREGLLVTIVSGDRDLLQLATDRVLVRIPKTKGGKTVIEDYHTREVLEKYQLTPPQIIDLKALMGDSSDNIPGIPGVGEKTATKLVSTYGSLEEAYAHLEEIKPKKAMESLRDHYDLAVLSKKLATICTDSPVSLDLEQARLKDLYTEQAYELFKELNFKNLLPRFQGQGGGGKEPEVQILEELGRAEEVFARASGTDKLGLALLADQEIRGVALSLGKEETYYIPAAGFLSGAWLKAEAERAMNGAGEVCVFDLKEILKHTKPERNGQFFDARIAAYLLNPLKSSYSYDDIAKEFAGTALPSQEEIFGGKPPAAADMSPEAAARCCGLAAWTSRRASAPMMEKLCGLGMEKLFREMEMPLVFTLDDMEKAGIAVEGGALKEYGEKLQEGISALEEKIYRQAGETFNINSPKQLGVILFDKMKLPGAKKTKSGYSTAADVLEKLAPEAPVVADILEYRQLAKLKSTYADGLGNCIAGDGRIHSSFNQTITATGRISSTEPNLQNIPVRMELGRQIRKVFVPREGCLFIDADYSQIELRVLAHLSGDEKLIEAYREAKDIHRITASEVFHVPFEEVTPLQRRNAKAVNFGIVYGISSFGLSQDLSISRKEAADYIEKYFHTYPKIKEFLDRTVEQAKRDGYVTTLFGRRRPVPELFSGNFMQRSFGERVAMNSPIQGTAADIIKIAMVRVNRRLSGEGLKSRLLLQVHDELLVEAPLEEVEKASRVLLEEMKGAAHLEVELEVDMHTGKNWYEAK
ncbi:MAG TPA: DNA polymerase I [Candidatus Scatomonas merdigallinarum]|nr:DNA polymerase I [Candidatus Scatomonas merdigallinarum]